MVPEPLMELVRNAGTIAVVGVSPRKGRASLRIYRFLKERGYRVFPVNPYYPQVDGDVTFPTLLHIRDQVDVVDVFRRGDRVFPIVKDAIRKEAKLIWLQKAWLTKRRSFWPRKQAYLWSWTGASTRNSWPFVRDWSRGLFGGSTRNW